MKKYQVITHCGIYWSGWSAVIGEYRWLWVAKCRAWWHVRIENPYRAVTVESKPPGLDIPDISGKNPTL